MKIEGIEVSSYYTMTPYVESHTKMKTVVCFKYIFDASIQNGGLKRVWISTENNGSQSYVWWFIKKTGTT